jgi:hypothetical protein
MKITKWVVLLSATSLPFLNGLAQTPPEESAPPEAAVPALSPNAAEVVRLSEAGTSDDVVLAYVQNATTPFSLSADQILYLRDIGVSSSVITAMLGRDNTLRGQGPTYNYDQKLYPATVPPPAPEPAPAETSAPVPAPAAEPVSAPLTPPPVYVSSPPPEVNYFYSNLSPYGTWIQLDGVGWCWQPRVVVINRGWRPYCDSGHWVYTDAGWFWQSDYSWGWAPFHYGRWQLHDRCGWVWLPDRVWGPAWVSWRYEGDHCGWAPLPPHADFDLRLGFRFNGVHVAANFDFGLRPQHYTFIALRDFHNHDFAHHRLPPTEVTKIYNHTTVINNYVVNNKTVVNEGVKVDRVAAATHTPIRKVAIRDVPGPGAAMASRSAAKGEKVVYRPQLKADPKPVHMVAQKVDDRHPVVQPAPVVAPRPARPMLAGNNPGANRGPVAQPQGNGRAYRPENTPSAAPNGQRGNQQPKSAPLTPAPSARPQPDRPAGRSSSATFTSPSYRQYPLQTTSPSHQDPPRATGQGAGAYYPKGYYQASEAHSLPPVNSRGAEALEQPSVNSRPQAGREPAARNPGGPGRKKDQ